MELYLEPFFSDAIERRRLTLEKYWREGDAGGLIGLDYPGQSLEESGDSSRD